MPTSQRHLIVARQHCFFGIFLKDLAQSLRQLSAFLETCVHTLDADRPGLVRGVARQPTAVSTKTRHQTVLEPDFCTPGDLSDTRREPRRPALCHSLHTLPNAFVNSWLLEPHRPPVFFRQFGPGLRST
jgi:hypothetical protein